MKKTTIKVHGTPKPQPRPRAFSRGGHAGVYDPGTSNEWKSCVKLAMRNALSEIIRCPVIVQLDFNFKRPASHYRSGRFSGELREDAPRWHVKKPDADNLAKAVLDALTDMKLWLDDSQVVSLSVTKQWADITEPGCLIMIEPFGSDD